MSLLIISYIVLSRYAWKRVPLVFVGVQLGCTRIIKGRITEHGCLRMVCWENADVRGWK